MLCYRLLQYFEAVNAHISPKARLNFSPSKINGLNVLVDCTIARLSIDSNLFFAPSRPKIILNMPIPMRNHSNNINHIREPSVWHSTPQTGTTQMGRTFQTHVIQLDQKGKTSAFKVNWVSPSSIAFAYGSSLRSGASPLSYWVWVSPNQNAFRSGNIRHTIRLLAAWYQFSVCRYSTQL